MKKTRKSRQASTGSRQIPLLPEPDCNPLWPRKNTLLARALYLMLKGEKINALGFEDETSSQRLPAYIETLSNKLGWPIQREDVSVYLEDEPKVRSFRNYYLEKEFITKVKNAQEASHDK